jgi:hypothetical protein
MVILSATESFPSSSGLFDVGRLEGIYQTFIDTSFTTLGRTITVHLPPEIQQDVTTQSRPQGQQVNPFFGGRVPIPRTNTRSTGTRIVPRDRQYTAHIKIGPLQEGDDAQGIGDLKENQAAITLDIAALEDVKNAQSISIEGRRYSVHETRPIGFSNRKYIIVILDEIQELDSDTSLNAG